MNGKTGAAMRTTGPADANEHEGVGGGDGARRATRIRQVWSTSRAQRDRSTGSDAGATIPVTASPAKRGHGDPDEQAQRPSPSTAALGAAGCSEANASTMNTNGIRQRPNAMDGGGAGRAGLVGAGSHETAQQDHSAGASNTVAMVIARHLRCGLSGSRLAGDAARRLTPSPSRR